MEAVFWGVAIWLLLGLITQFFYSEELEYEEYDFGTYFVPTPLTERIKIALWWPPHLFSFVLLLILCSFVLFMLVLPKRD